MMFIYMYWSSRGSIQSSVSHQQEKVIDFAKDHLIKLIDSFHQNETFKFKLNNLNTKIQQAKSIEDIKVVIEDFNKIRNNQVWPDKILNHSIQQIESMSG